MGPSGIGLWGGFELWADADNRLSATRGITWAISQLGRHGTFAGRIIAYAEHAMNSNAPSRVKA
jgi:hypothetical protein